MTEVQREIVEVYARCLKINYGDILELSLLNNFVNGYKIRLEKGTGEYEKALSLGIIREDGSPYEGLADALIIELNRRIDNGTL